MARHLGASIFLSVAFVAVSAVILYQPEAATPPPNASPPIVPKPRADAVPRSASPIAAKGPSDRPAEKSADPGQSETAPAAAARPVGDGTPVRAVAHRRGISEARSEFTEVLRGETLADVAARVYGSPESAAALWAANRDLLERRDGPLAAGTLLRTP